VLVEGPSKKNASIYSGYSEESKLVNFTAPIDMSGQIISVKIKQANTWTLKGEAILD